LDIATSSNGNFIVVWDDGGSTHARIYGPNGVVAFPCVVSKRSM
jgi:hypothetical protein